MAVLVTRTAARRRNYRRELARAGTRSPPPMLRFEPFGFDDEAEVPYGGIIVTSANAVRAVESQLTNSPLLKLPLFAVGERTAAVAHAAGFGNVISAEGDATALRDLVVETAKAKKLKKKSPLLYLAGEEIARDLPGELREQGFEVVTHIAYRMVPAKSLPSEVVDGFAAGGSRPCCIIPAAAPGLCRGGAGRGGNLALALPQCCTSAEVAEIVRRPVRPRSRSRPGRTKMPYSRH
jgi:uroporphyrinogen-III synthase